jgi:hypothetical protein
MKRKIVGVERAVECLTLESSDNQSLDQMSKEGEVIKDEQKGRA